MISQVTSTFLLLLLLEALKTRSIPKKRDVIGKPNKMDVIGNQRESLNPARISLKTAAGDVIGIRALNRKKYIEKLRSA